MGMVNDQESVAANLDGFGKDWIESGKQRNLDAHFLQLGFFHGSKARIFQGGAHSATDYGFAYGFVWFRHSDTSLQATPHMKGDEDSAPLRENSLAGDDVWKPTV